MCFFISAAISFGEKLIATHKQDLRFFTELRRMAKTDAQETVDFSAYDEQIRKLVDRYVVGEKIVESGKLVEVTHLGLKEDPIDWSVEKTRNETDIIKSRLTRTIEQELEQVLDLLQPGWRGLVIERRFLPRMTVTNALVTAGGLAKRPHPAVSGLDGLYVAGDWVGGEGQLADASFASAKAAAEMIAQRHPHHATGTV